jgi:hypothetical protein
MKASNINLVKSDVDFMHSDDIQDQINRDREEARRTGGPGSNLLDKGKQVDDLMQEKKVKITYDEYEKIAYMVAYEMKKREAEGEENVQQTDILNSLIQSMLLSGED